MSWRERLREAVRDSGMKHSIIALDAGIAPETLSRVLGSKHGRPRFDTIVRITHATGHTVDGCSKNGDSRSVPRK